MMAERKLLECIPSNVNPVFPDLRKFKEIEKAQDWLTELSNFIVEANAETWASDGGKLKSEEGFKRHGYDRDDWSLRDRYSGYFKAPGITTVSFHGTPVWVMQYGGRGMLRGYERQAKETFSFLRKALMEVSPDMPYRGPEEYKEAGWKYNFQLEALSNIMEFQGREVIHGVLGSMVFEQIVFGGLVIHKGSEGQPVFPWNFWEMQLQ